MLKIFTDNIPYIEAKNCRINDMEKIIYDKTWLFTSKKAVFATFYSFMV